VAGLELESGPGERRMGRVYLQSTSCIFVSVMLTSVLQHILAKHVSRLERAAANE
jgi:hypothetical protein